MAESLESGAGRSIGRRSVLAWITGAGVLAALAAAYGTFAAYLARFLYPSGPANRGWIFVRELARFQPGESLAYITPSGATVNVARLAARAEQPHDERDRHERERLCPGECGPEAREQAGRNRGRDDAG